MILIAPLSQLDLKKTFAASKKDHRGFAVWRGKPPCRSSSVLFRSMKLLGAVAVGRSYSARRCVSLAQSPLRHRRSVTA